MKNQLIFNVVLHQINLYKFFILEGIMAKEIIPLAFIAAFAAASPAQAVIVKGFCNGSGAQGDSAQVFFRGHDPNTFKVPVESNGFYPIGFPMPNPPLNPTDIAEVTVYGPTGTTRLKRTLDSLSNTFSEPQTFIYNGQAGFGANILNIRDRSNNSGTLWGKVYFNSNPSQFLNVAVDTSGLKFTDFAANLKLLPAYAVGADYTVELWKSGVTNRTIVPAAVDTLKGDAMYAALEATFYGDSGVEEQKVERIKRSSNGMNVGYYNIAGQYLGNKKPTRNGIFYRVSEDGKKDRILNVR